MRATGGFSDPPQQPEGSVVEQVAKQTSPTFFSKVQGLGASTLKRMQDKDGPLNSGPEEPGASDAGALQEPGKQGDGTTKQAGSFDLCLLEIYLGWISTSSRWWLVFAR